jgi:hypothetical protein
MQRKIMFAPTSAMLTQKKIIGVSTQGMLKQGIIVPTPGMFMQRKIMFTPSSRMLTERKIFFLYKRPMGHIAHLSNLGPCRNIICISFPFDPRGGQLAFVPCQQAFLYNSAFLAS